MVAAMKPHGKMLAINWPLRWVPSHVTAHRLVREGRITLEQAAVHPQRSVITRALGIEADIEVDDVALELTGGDRVLICSDGLSGMVRDAETAQGWSTAYAEFVLICRAASGWRGLLW